MTIRGRLVLLSAVAVAVAIAIASVAVYLLVRSGLRGEIDAALRTAQGKARVVNARMAGKAKLVGSLPPEDVPGVRIALPSAKFGDATGIAQLITSKGDVVAPAGGAPPLPAIGLGAIRGRGKPALSDRRVNGVHLRVLTTKLPGGDFLLVARPLTEVERTLRNLLWILLAVTVGGIGLAAALGLLVARGTLRPLRRVTASAEQVAATQDLSHRLPDGGGRDEIDRLASSFNQMLAALESSRAAQRQLVADASHELRTPLTSVRTNVELLARAPDLPAPERERIVTSVGSQIQELAVLVGDLVDLARPNGVDPQEVVEDVRLDLLVADVVVGIRGHAPGHAFVLDAQPCTVRASRPRLHRAVRNLLDNAVKWSPLDARVEVTVAGGEVTVRDHGPGIADEDLPHVFDRFYRAPAARRLPGSGLGLAIVRQVAEASGGTVTAERAETGGARLRLRLSQTS